MTSTKAQINNLGIPPIGGICTYDEACRVGYSVDHSVDLLKRYNYIKTQTYYMILAHINKVPEWEVKGGISYHVWLEAEHSSLIRKRVGEMRHPPLFLDKVPDERLQSLMEEAIRSNSTLELLTALYRVIKPEMIRSLKHYIAHANPLVDLPTCRSLKLILDEDEMMLQWGEQAIQALIKTAADRQEVEQWTTHLLSYLNAAGGFSGDLTIEVAIPTPKARYDGKPYEMDSYPQRDDRFQDTFNAFYPGVIFNDTNKDPLERTIALASMRLREMDVPEFMSAFIYNTKGKPWEYYHDLGRQLFDEVRHSMMGEVALYNEGIAFHDYPIQKIISVAYNTKLTPLEAHSVLWGIEQGLMPKETGKRYEWVVAMDAGNELVATFQDFDWADEVLHAQNGRKWLTSEFKNMDEMIAFKDASMKKWGEAINSYKHLSKQEDWWTPLMDEIRRKRENKAS